MLYVCVWMCAWMLPSVKQILTAAHRDLYNLACANAQTYTKGFQKLSPGRGGRGIFSDPSTSGQKNNCETPLPDKSTEQDPTLRTKNNDALLTQGYQSIRK